MWRRVGSLTLFLGVLLTGLLTPHLFAPAYGAAREKASVPGKEITLKDGQMEVVLDSQFPRVIEYRVPSRPKLLGTIASDRPTVELNGTIYTPAEFTVTSQATPQRASYRIVFPKLRLTLELAFQLEGNELLMKLARVDESGDFRLNSLYFPSHFLIRMPALMPGASMYRGEFKRTPWKDPSYRGGYGMDVPRFAAIAEEDGEEYPVRVNWAAAYGSGLAATIQNNIGFWKLATQFLGYNGRATDLSVWNGTYYYRLRGKQRPLLESRIAVLTTDGNGDGKVDWIEAALWQRKFIRAGNPIYACPTYTYKIICAWFPRDKFRKLAESAPPGQRPDPDIDQWLSTEPVTTFEESLQIIKSVHNLTGGVPQIIYLVGWQYGGHDDGYPSLDQVNPALGGREKLYWLAREAKKYNAIISYHINLDDAYPHNPGFDPSVLCLGLDGKPYTWCFYGGVNRAYHISHTKEVETGYFQKRAQAFFDTVPLERTLHCDTLRYSNLSFAPGDFIGMNEELELGVKEIFGWFAARGVDIGAEGPYEGFYGTLSYFLWLSADSDPFHAIMMHGKAYGTGEPLEPVLGWQRHHAMQMHASDPRAAYSISETTDNYYLGVLLQSYLRRKELRYLGPEGSDYVARFADGCVSRRTKDGSKEVKYDSLIVQEGDVVIARGQDDRFIPLSDSEIRLYSVSGGEQTWTLPAGWAGAQVTLSELSSEGAHEIREFRIENNRLKLTAAPRRPYVLRKR
jgi:hypothetical protein